MPSSFVATIVLFGSSVARVSRDRATVVNATEGARKGGARARKTITYNEPGVIKGICLNMVVPKAICITQMCDVNPQEYRRR